MKRFHRMAKEDPTLLQHASVKVEDYKMYSGDNTTTGGGMTLIKELSDRGRASYWQALGKGLNDIYFGLCESLGYEGAQEPWQSVAAIVEDEVGAGIVQAALTNYFARYVSDFRSIFSTPIEFCLGALSDRTITPWGASRRSGIAPRGLGVCK